MCSRHRLFNLFVPLVDLAEDGDGTMMWPGSHLEQRRYDEYNDAMARSGSLEADEQAMAQMEVPGCPAGGLILWDFRLLHRGQPNPTGRDRAVAHAVLSTGGAKDRLTFPEMRLSDAVAAVQQAEGADHATIAQIQQEAWTSVRESSIK